MSIANQVCFSLLVGSYGYPTQTLIEINFFIYNIATLEKILLQSANLRKFIC